MANPLAIALQASAAQTASGQATGVDAGALRKMARLRLEVSAVSGATPSLTVSVETGPSSSGPWRSLGSFTAATAAGVQDKSFGELDRYVRASWTISGTTPSFTFSVSGTAHVLYAAPSHVTRFALPAAALSGIDLSDQLDSCLGATDEAEGYISSAYTLPLTAWGEDLAKHVANMAGFDMLRRRGFQPEGPDQVVIDGRDHALSWLKLLATGRIRPVGIVDSTPDTFEAGAYVVSSPKRGW
jgi:phage gp36-like protein